MLCETSRLGDTGGVEGAYNAQANTWEVDRGIHTAANTVAEDRHRASGEEDVVGLTPLSHLEVAKQTMLLVWFWQEKMFVMKIWPVFWAN